MQDATDPPNAHAPRSASASRAPRPDSQLIVSAASLRMDASSGVSSSHAGSQSSAAPLSSKSCAVWVRPPWHAAPERVVDAFWGRRIRCGE
jgi:hypothetical protein